MKSKGPRLSSIIYSAPLARFDFHKLSLVYKCMRWELTGVGIPSYEELRKLAANLYRDAEKYHNSDMINFTVCGVATKCTHEVGCGGLSARCDGTIYFDAEGRNLFRVQALWNGLLGDAN